MKTLKEELTADVKAAVKDALEGVVQSDIFQGAIDGYLQSFLDDATCWLMEDGNVMVSFDGAVKMFPLELPRKENLTKHEIEGIKSLICRLQELIK